MTQFTTSPSRISLDCQEIDENDPKLGNCVSYCKRYWGKPGDYGTSTSPEAEEYIDRYNSVWREQARRSETQDDFEGDKEDVDKAAQMENTATHEDYHESLRLLHARPKAEGDLKKDPILIRSEYARLYDRLKFLHSQRCKAILTGQPGIGSLLVPPLIQLI